MKKLSLPALAAGILLLAGCDKPSSATTGSAPIQALSWGVVEVAASTQTHLSLEGKDCTLTATPLTDGKLAVLIEGDFRVAGTNAPPGVPPGTPIHTTQNMILPANVEVLCDVANKMVRLTLKLKPS
jgi:hypothetical protein